ncbi:MAG: GNAT family protein [Anaerolineae bacterium]
MPLNLTGSKIKLRPLEARDLDAILPMYEDFDLQITTDGDAPPLSDTQVRAFWEEIISDPGPELRYFAIEPLAGNTGAGQFAGACSLQHIDLRNRHAELGIFMASREMRGQGYGTEATHLLLGYGFDVLRLDKIHLGVYDFNEGGLRTYENIGFRYEGRLRNMLYYEGRYWDEWPMAVLRAEWERYNQPPADGLRLYHPSDQDAALNLIHEQRGLPDRESARSLLRHWWRQIDREVYAYQVDGRLVGIATVIVTETETPNVLDVIAYETYDSDFIAALQNL